MAVWAVRQELASNCARQQGINTCMNKQRKGKHERRAACAPQRAHLDTADLFLGVTLLNAAALLQDPSRPVRIRGQLGQGLRREELDPRLVRLP